VLFSGLAPGFAGLYQVSIVIPEGVEEGDWIPIDLRMPWPSYGSDQATIAISR
jgi:uncharacterized protein (TIGR03437 family)